MPFGQPFTDLERTARHIQKFGSDILPPRGTARMMQSFQHIDPIQIVGTLIAMGISAAVAWYIAKSTA